MKESIERFLDAEGRLKAWPAKRAMQKLMIEYVSEKFEHGRVYSEKEVNAILTKWHTFGDYFILRRGLIEEGLMVRTPNGAEYRRSEVVLAKNAENSRSDISPAENAENSRSDASPAENTEISFPETIDDYIATQPEAVQPIPLQLIAEIAKWCDATGNHH